MTAKIGSEPKYLGKIRLDWQAYFHRFVEVHGEPVESDGVLLFQDGWRYSITSYNGPEYPPPTDRRKLLQLHKVYWTKQREKLDLERRGITLQIQGYEDWNDRMSLPLQQAVLVPERRGGNTVYRKLTAEEMGGSTDLNLTILKHQLADLDYQLNECDTELAKHKGA